MANFFLPAGYRENVEPRYDDDIHRDGEIWQPEVYRLTLSHIVPATTDKGVAPPWLIDVGCGKAGKLLALDHARTVGLDHGENIRYLRARHPTRDWMDIDLEEIRPDALPSSTIRGSVIVCADVVEHLKNPFPLLRTLATWRTTARAMLITTPDRERTWGRDHLGPPPNACHVREWSAREFADLLKSVGLDPVIGHTQSVNLRPERNTILATC